MPLLAAVVCENVIAEIDVLAGDFSGTHRSRHSLTKPRGRTQLFSLECDFNWLETIADFSLCRSGVHFVRRRDALRAVDDLKYISLCGRCFLLADGACGNLQAVDIPFTPSANDHAD